MEAPSSVFSRFRLCVGLVCLPWFCFSSFVPPCSLFLFFSSFLPVLCFYLRPFCLSSLPVLCLLCSCSSIPRHIFFLFFCFFKKTLPVATECHAVTQIIKSLWDCYSRSNGRRRFVGRPFFSSSPDEMKRTNSSLSNGVVFLTKMVICNCVPGSNTNGPLHFGIIYKIIL